MNFVNLLEQYDDDPVMKGEILKALDYMLKYLHDRGYYIYDFNPFKIILQDGKLTPSSFQALLRRSDEASEEKIINIYQSAKIGLLAFNNLKIDGNMNQEHFNFLRDNLSKFNNNNLIPSEIYEYYEEVFLRNNVDYLNNYLKKKAQERLASGTTNAIRKTLATEAGLAMDSGRQFVSFQNENSAFVNILFIPSIMVLIYLIGLFIYTFIVK